MNINNIINNNKFIYIKNICNSVYIIVFVLWSLKALKYRKDILQIQHYITGIIIIVTSEMMYVKYI